MDKIIPRREFVDQYKRAKDEIARLGVEFCY